MDPGAHGDRAATDRSQRILDELVRADVFEQMFQSLYIGTKRFSLEGETALIPLLEEACKWPSSMVPRKA